MNQRELEILHSLGYPFDIIAENHPNESLARVESQVTFPAYLVKLYVACRFLPGWPDGDAIVSCAKALEIAMGVEKSLFTCCLHTFVPVLSAGHVAHEAMSGMLYAERDELPEDDHKGRIDATVRVYAVCCRLIREILHPPAEQPGEELKVEPVIERLSPDGLTSDLLPSQEKSGSSADAPLKWHVPPAAVYRALLWWITWQPATPDWHMTTERLSFELYRHDRSGTLPDAWDRMVKALFASGIFSTADDGRLLIDWEEVNGRFSRALDDRAPLALDPSSGKDTRVVLTDRVKQPVQFTIDGMHAQRG